MNSAFNQIRAQCQVVDQYAINEVNPQVDRPFVTRNVDQEQEWLSRHAVKGVISMDRANLFVTDTHQFYVSFQNPASNQLQNNPQ